MVDELAQRHGQREHGDRAMSTHQAATIIPVGRRTAAARATDSNDLDGGRSAVAFIAS